ncbi:MAG: hypothetical protein HRU76_13245 [Phycisphaeraceae bacterium]|nr:MAG: hypothetical protein HRU76_13245 [Phycisphaeraceae bacterium]
MKGAIEVSDSLSNAEEQIERAAKTVGRGEVRPKVFAAIYHHKQKIKSVTEVMKKSGLKNRIRVLQEGRHLVRKGIARSAMKDGETAYEMIDFFHAHKPQILKLAANPKKLAAFPTKRKSSVSVTVNGNGAKAQRPKAVALTLDDFDSFKALSKVKADGFIPRTVSEDQFKRGVQAILGEPGDWRDWGGEMFDLSSTQLIYKGKRIGAVFAFKGPGTRGPLTPKKMGKNGDQIGRMYKGVGRVFILQYGESVEESVRQLMRTHAVEKSDATGETIFHVIIDGTDSHRLYRAYPTEFAKAAKKKTKKKKAKKAKR